MNDDNQRDTGDESDTPQQPLVSVPVVPPGIGTPSAHGGTVVGYPLEPSSPPVGQPDLEHPEGQSP